MKVVKSKKPVFKVQGVKTLRGVGFSTQKEAERELRIHAIMALFWEPRFQPHCYDIACKLVAQRAQLMNLLELLP